MRNLLPFLCCLAIATPLRAEEPKSLADKPIKVPFTLMPTGHFLVTVHLNGKGPYKLIFDTGAPTMLINNRIAKDSGVLNKNTPKPLFAPFGAAGPVVIKSLQVGDVKAENVSAMVMDHPTVKTFSDFFKKEHGEIDGIVGFPFFAKFKTTVDYQAKELTFVPNDYQPADVMQSMMAAIMGASSNGGKPKVVGAAGYWGLRVDKEAKDDDSGVNVKSVAKDSPAEKAGLKVGDRLLTIDGRWTDSIGDTYLAASFVKAGKKVTVTVLRDGKELNLTAIPGKGL